MEKQLFIFECGCRRPDFIYLNKGNQARVCPEHKASLKEKVRYCRVCGIEMIVKKMCNSVRVTCNACNPTYRVKKNVEGNRKRGRPATGKAVTKEDVIYVTPIERLLRHLDKQFPSPIKPEFSNNFMRLLDGRLKTDRGICTQVTTPSDKSDGFYGRAEGL